MSSVPTSSFSNDPSVLRLQIRWLLNEMSYTIDLIKEEKYDEAISILSKEVVENKWLLFNDKNRLLEALKQ